MSGELIFTIVYGSALVVMGFVTKGFLRKMKAESNYEEIVVDEKIVVKKDSTKNYNKVGNL